MNDIIIPVRFTKREIVIMRMLCDGLTHVEIGKRLNIKKRTSHAYTIQLYAKVGVASLNGRSCVARIKLFRFAVESGIIRIQVKRTIR